MWSCSLWSILLRSQVGESSPVGLSQPQFTPFGLGLREDVASCLRKQPIVYEHGEPMAFFDKQDFYFVRGNVTW